MEALLGFQGERLKGFVLRRLMTLGRSPYLSEFEWNEGQNVDLGNVCDSKVGEREKGV